MQSYIKIAKRTNLLSYPMYWSIMQINTYPGRQVMKNGKQETTVGYFSAYTWNTLFIKEKTPQNLCLVKLKA